MTQRRHGHPGLGAAALGLLLASACVPPPDPLDVNHAPVARVVVPQLWPVSAPVTIDGSFSDDEDGDALRFTVDWGDGTPAAQDDDGIAQHSYAAPGTWALELTVEDSGGIPARVQAAIVVVGDDDSGCSCELGCFEDAVCTARGCLTFQSSADEGEGEGEAPPAEAFGDALVCP